MFVLGWRTNFSYKCEMHNVAGRFPVKKALTSDSDGRRSGNGQLVAREITSGTA